MKKRINQKKSIFVYAHWEKFEIPIKMGVLYSERVKGKEIFSFEYTNDWLQKHTFQLLDPELLHYSGLHYNTN